MGASKTEITGAVTKGEGANCLYIFTKKEERNHLIFKLVQKDKTEKKRCRHDNSIDQTPCFNMLLTTSIASYTDKKIINHCLMMDPAFFCWNYSCIGGKEI